MRRSLILLVLALALSSIADDYNSASWKGEISRGYLPYRKLKFEDFPVTSNVPTPHLMNTQGFVHFTYRAQWSVNNGTVTAAITEIDIKSGFDQNKSWKQGLITETKSLLEHEQGHLDINELHAYDFRHAALPVGSADTQDGAATDLKSKLRALCDKYADEASTEQAKYDQETNHGTNLAQQERWTNALRKRLDERGITYWDETGTKSRQSG